MAWTLGATDLDGYDRIIGTQVDMGAFEVELPDSDGDGLPNWWEQQWFGGATNGVANADTNGDGYSNLEKFNNGGNPLVFDIGSAYIWTRWK